MAMMMMIRQSPFEKVEADSSAVCATETRESVLYPGLTGFKKKYHCVDRYGMVPHEKESTPRIDGTGYIVCMHNMDLCR